MARLRSASVPARNASALLQAWADLSLRAKLLLFALGLVTLPGLVFAFFAFAGARGALEREIGIQLQQTAERGADGLAAALQRAQSDARAWASQDVMRELLVGDVDKRVSRFLQTLKDSQAGYLEVLCIDESGTVLAASSGTWLGRRAGGRTDGTLVGPHRSAELAREVIEIGVPIANPDPPGNRIGQLLLIYDWAGAQTRLDAIRAKLANLGKRVAVVVIDRDGKTIGGVAFDGGAAQQSSLATVTWHLPPAGGYGKRKVGLGSDGPVGLLIGAATVAAPSTGWSVLFIEPTSTALAAVQSVRTRWTIMLAVLLVIGLVVATLLARQVLRPLNEVTRTTSAIAAHPERELPLLPVRSRNEVGQLTDSFNKMTVALKRSQAEALSAAKFAFAGELAAMVAHEVRTPLSVMRSSAQMLAPPAATGQDAELVETIVAEVDRVERVVTGLIELARPLQQHIEPTPLHEVLARAAAFIAPQARRQDIDLRCDAGDVGLALADSEQIYQVVLNLLMNALQALPPGGTISLGTLPRAGDTIGFEVADNGPGLPREIRDRIFQPFVTGREHGTGLGLAFVDRVIKAHRGSLSVSSESGQGTTFAVRLPRAEN